MLQNPDDGRSATKGGLWIGRLGLVAGLSAVFTVPALPASSAQQSLAPGSGVIRGKVLAENGRGLPQATIFLHRVGDQPDAMRWTNSDADGKFQFGSLAEGAYRLTVTSLGYVMEGDPITGKAELPLYYPGDSVSLSLEKGGIITGAVTDAAGNPAVNAQVTALPVEREGKEFPLRFPVRTDDRGIYRIYGLHAGNYHVRAGGSASNYSFSAYDGIAPSFYSMEADGAPSVVGVRTGLEITGIDMRLRAEIGQTIRGEVTLSPSLKSSKLWAEINLIHAESGILERTSATSRETLAGKFTLAHIPDGNYYLLAQTPREMETRGASTPVPLSIRGQDVSNVKLVMNPLGTLAGRVVIEKTETGAECAPPGINWMKGLVLSTRRLPDRKQKSVLDPFLPSEAETAVGNKGEFQLAGLATGSHQLSVHLPLRALYLKSVKPGMDSATGAKPAASRLVFSIRGSQAAENLQITLAPGAAEISGHIAAPAGEAGSAGAVRIFLVPAEENSTDDILRYAETRPDGNGAFQLRNLAPGSYSLLPWPERNIPATTAELPAFFSSSFRLKLRQAAAHERGVTLKPCQSLAGLELTIPR